MNLLIVEDDRELCSLLKDSLKKYNYTCDTAYDGEEGMYYIGVNEYDAIILDINSPKIDGITLCKTVREKLITTPIIMLTARTDTEDKIIGLDSGADDSFRRNNNFCCYYGRWKIIINAKIKEKSRMNNKILIKEKDKI